MKKKGFVLGMAALVLSLSLVFFGCDSDGGSDDTYAGTTFRMTLDNFNSTFNMSVTAGGQPGEITGDDATIAGKIQSAPKVPGSEESSNGLTLSQIEARLAQLKNEGFPVDVDLIMNELRRDGSVAAYAPLGSTGTYANQVGVIAAIKE